MHISNLYSLIRFEVCVRAGLPCVSINTCASHAHSENGVCVETGCALAHNECQKNIATRTEKDSYLPLLYCLHVVKKGYCP